MQITDRRSITWILGLIVSLAMVPAAIADDTYVTGKKTFGPNAQFENLIIKEGATAILNGSRVDGNIFVRPGATLIAHHVTVGGNIQSTNAKRVSVKHSFIDGDFQMDNTGPIMLLHSTVGGNVQLFSNNAGLKQIRICRNTVGGDIQAESNISSRFVVSFNVIDGNLQGESNNKRPTGKGNFVKGDTDGQFDKF